MTKTVEKIDLRSVAELKWAKRWIKRAWGGPPEGWSSKTTPDEPRYEVPSSESDPRAHKRTHAPARGRQAVGEKQHVTARAELFSSGVATDM